MNRGNNLRKGEDLELGMSGGDYLYSMVIVSMPIIKELNWTPRRTRIIETIEDGVLCLAPSNLPGAIFGSPAWNADHRPEAWLFRRAYARTLEIGIGRGIIYRPAYWISSGTLSIDLDLKKAQMIRNYQGH